MAFPKLSSFDANAFRSRLVTSIGAFPVFDQFVVWKQSLDKLRDASAATDVFAHDIKRDLDDFRENVGVANASFDRRLDALEAASSTTPFPASG